MFERYFRISVSASACLENIKGEILLVQQRETLAWGPPAGKRELSETPRQTIWREIEEECGLDSIKIEDLRWVGCRVIPKMPRKISVGFVFLGKIKAVGEFLPNDPDDDIKAVKFFTRNDIKDLISLPTNVHHPEFSLLVLRDWLKK